ncbi:fimbria/pilus outer membrane usher protein [Ralstonia sp. A12]|uniref:fimbria/pilus outer membrane usher protein n=1 Tax=Ralstonia sp. A12 TaxID=1217052 RepID=UPI0006938AC5|nr:fimbria/pilus outer membrane usher protein [Ralstonia sp. A12]
MARTITLRSDREDAPPRLPQFLPQFPLSPIFLLVLGAMSPAAFAIEQKSAEGRLGTASNDKTVTFDADALRARGIDPALAAYFSQSSRFTPGVQRVKLFVNDVPHGAVMARFDGDGQLCIDRTLLERGGLQVPAALQGGAAPACYDYRQDVPQAEIELDPGANTIRMVVPQEAMKSMGSSSGTYATGGTAAMLNYSVLGMTNRSGGANSNFVFGDGEVGVNAGDWIVRSRHSYTSQNGSASTDHLYTYAQKTFVDRKAMVQAGQINVTNTLLPVPSITGVQYAPDQALVPQQGGPSFEGIANSQARVDVRQMGVLIYSTVVPAGPFTLSSLPLVSASADLEVVLTEADGQQRRYNVPAASLRPGARPAQGLSVAVGKVRDVSHAGTRQPALVTATQGWNVSERHNVTASGLVTSGYQAAAAGLNSVVSNRVSANVQSIVSNAQRENLRGVNVSGSVNVQLAESWSAGVSMTQQSQGYRDVSDTLSDSPSGTSARFRSQYTASMSWQHASLGGISASYSRGSTYYGASTQYAVASWSRKVGPGTLSVNLEKDLSSARTRNVPAAGQDSFRFYAMYSLPLGKASVQSYASNTGGSTRFGTGVSQTVNDTLSYSARAETNPSGHGPNLSGSATITPRYTRAMVSYSQTGANNATYSGQLQGGLVVTRAGLTLSPYQVGDTFGVVKTGDLSGVRISTPQGTVWTDAGGRAVIPSLSPYRQSRVELLTKSLPRNIDINNGIEYIDAGRGSVHVVEFGVNKVRRVLVRATLADGSPLPAALPVLDADNRYVTTSVGDGTVFLDNAPESALHVKLPDDRVCRIEVNLPATPDANRPFDTVPGVCKL